MSSSSTQMEIVSVAWMTSTYRQPIARQRESRTLFLARLILSKLPASVIRTAWKSSLLLVGMACPWIDEFGRIHLHEARRGYSSLRSRNVQPRPPRS